MVSGTRSPTPVPSDVSVDGDAQSEADVAEIPKPKKRRISRRSLAEVIEQKAVIQADVRKEELALEQEKLQLEREKLRIQAEQQNSAIKIQTDTCNAMIGLMTAFADKLAPK